MPSGVVVMAGYLGCDLGAHLLIAAHFGVVLGLLAEFAAETNPALVFTLLGAEAGAH